MIAFIGALENDRCSAETLARKTAREVKMAGLPQHTIVLRLGVGNGIVIPFAILIYTIGTGIDYYHFHFRKCFHGKIGIKSRAAK
jgi:hypothetical protein